jgi:predicted amidohydrolase YtcJ
MLPANGRIYTMDAAGTIADTLVVRDGRIASVGRRVDVNPAVGEPVRDSGAPRGRRVPAAGELTTR